MSKHTINTVIMHASVRNHITVRVRMFANRGRRTMDREQVVTIE